MGRDPPHGEDPGGVPPLGDKADNGKYPKFSAGQGLGLTSDSGIHAGLGDQGGGSIYWYVEDHCGKFHIP